MSVSDHGRSSANSSGQAPGVPELRAGAGARLTHDEERDLARRIQDGDDGALATLMSAHQRLVNHVAMRYRSFGLPTSDLIQEGMVGLLYAVRRFNPDRDVRLATYASWWVRAAIQEYVFRSWSAVRYGRTSGHRSVFANLRQMAAGWRAGTSSFTEDAAALAHRFNVPVADAVAMAWRFTRGDLSLDAAVASTGGSEREGNDATMGDTLASSEPTPEEIAIARSSAQSWRQMLESALKSLSEREAFIIRRRHLSELRPTFEAIGRELGISKDRVRQLEARALKRLRETLVQLSDTEHPVPAP